MVDELVDFAEHDPELKDGLKYLDEEAFKRGITFYEMVFHVLHVYDTDKRAKEWRNNRN